MWNTYFVTGTLRLRNVKYQLSALTLEMAFGAFRCRQSHTFYGGGGEEHLERRAPVKIWSLASLRLEWNYFTASATLSIWHCQVAAWSLWEALQRLRSFFLSTSSSVSQAASLTRRYCFQYWVVHGATKPSGPWVRIWELGVRPSGDDA